MSAYADDVTVGLGDLDDVNDIIKILTQFGNFSGLKINLEKCEILSLNGKVSHNKNIEESSFIKITGIFFGDVKNTRKLEKLNFEPAIQAIKNKLNLWKMRALSLIGKVTVVKAHALSQIQFLAASVNTPKWVVDEIADLIANFVWNGKGKISKEKASKAWREGGLTIPLIDNLCKAANVKMILRAKEMEGTALWASNLVYELRRVGGVAALHPQTNLTEVKKKGIPQYVLSLIQNWQAIQKTLYPEWCKELTQFSPICFNMKITAPPIARRRVKVKLDMPVLLQAGLNTVGHWFDSQGKKLEWRQVKEEGLQSNAFFEWHKVLKALQHDRIVIKSEQTLMINTPSFSPVLHTKKGILHFPDITQKRILQEIAQAVEYVPNGTQVKVGELLDLEDNDLAYAFKNFKKDNPCTWKQEFQFKLLSGRVYANAAYHRMGLKDSSNCTFCNAEGQKFIHTYIDCPKVRMFRENISRDWQGDPMSDKRWFLGASNSAEVLEKAKNIIAKEINHYIFKMNYAGEQLSIEAFKKWLKSDEDPEEALASRVNKTFDHHLKWSNLQLLLQL